LGLANYYRRFVKDFAKIARPLHRLTEKTAEFKWDTDCQTAFEQIRACSGRIAWYTLTISL